MKRVWLLVVLSWPFGGYAYFESAGGLLETCDGDVVSYSQCVGFLQGVSDTMKSLKATGQIENVCLPRGTTSRRLVELFRAYAKAHPREIEIAASTVAIAAYREAWRCKPRR